MKTLCMSLECENTIERHPYNFGTGFCDDCQNEYYKSINEQDETK